MYKSPIRIITSDLGMKMAEKFDEDIYQAVLNAGISVDKAELLRALHYERGQYEKGYADGKADAPDWISVKDRLPEKTGLYVGFDSTFGVILAYYTMERMMPTWETITHWMPLPEAPKGE